MHFPFAEGFGGLETAVLGLLVLVTAFLLRRSSVQIRKTRKRDVSAEVKHEFLRTENRNEHDRLAVKLHDLVREVDALTQTRIAMLRELTAAADRAIVDLETQDGVRKSVSEMTPAQRRMVSLLAEAGHSPSSIAALLNRPETDVQRMIDGSLSENNEPHAA